MRRALRALKVRTKGRFEVTFIGPQRMRALNRRFLGHDEVTDVLSFRYDQSRDSSLVPRPSVVGEILVAPEAAHRYAVAHGLSYEGELNRYVIHGLLHWLGRQDATSRQQARMRRWEDHLLSTCDRASTVHPAMGPRPWPGPVGRESANGWAGCRPPAGRLMGAPGLPGGLHRPRSTVDCRPWTVD